MKSPLFLIISLFCCSILFAQNKSGGAINWKTIQQADSIQLKGDKRFIFMDVYTDWCGPCKMMDQYTFSNQEVADYINQNFIPVKLNAEAEAEIKFKDKNFKWISAGTGKGGIQSLAYVVLGGQLRYPSMPILNDKGETLTIITGFYQPKEFLDVIQDLKQQIDNHFSTNQK